MLGISYPCRTASSVAFSLATDSFGFEAENAGLKQANVFHDSLEVLLYHIDYRQQGLPILVNHVLENVLEVPGDCGFSIITLNFLHGIPPSDAIVYQGFRRRSCRRLS